MRVRHKLCPEYGEGVAKNWRFTQSVAGGPLWFVLVKWPNHLTLAAHNVGMLVFRVPAGRRVVTKEAYK